MLIQAASYTHQKHASLGMHQPWELHRSPGTVWAHGSEAAILRRSADQRPKSSAQVRLLAKIISFAMRNGFWLTNGH